MFEPIEMLNLNGWSGGVGLVDHRTVLVLIENPLHRSPKFTDYLGRDLLDLVRSVRACTPEFLNVGHHGAASR
jgi:hypothetical protein